MIDDKVERQDNKAELELIELFHLTRVPSRMSGIDAHDANGNPFQLKATSKTSGAYSTVRDLGPETLEKFLEMYFLFAATEDLTRTWFLAPQHMEGWCARQAEWFAVKRPQIDEALRRCPDLPDLPRMLNNGVRRNDPNISKNYIRKNGISINVDHPTSLEKLVDLYPLKKVAVANAIEFHTDIFR